MKVIGCRSVKCVEAKRIRPRMYVFFHGYLQEEVDGDGGSVTIMPIFGIDA